MISSTGSQIAIGSAPTAPKKSPRAGARAGSRLRWFRNVSVVLAAAAVALGTSFGGASARTFVIGGKAFTEQYVLAEITRQLLAREGLDVTTRVGYSTTEIRQAQLSGEVDISWDYTWTGYAFHNGMTEPKPIDDVLAEVRSMDEELGLVWLERSRVSNNYALAVNLDFAAEACIHSIADLAAAIRNGVQFRMASDQECHRREDCLLGLQRAYGFEIEPELIDVMNVSDTYEALRRREADFAVVYTTDGKITAYDFELLTDPEAVLYEYVLVPVVRADVLEEEPRVRVILEQIARSLDLATSQDLHYRVDVIGQPIDEVAEYFITLKGL